ncbi:MAG: hypothetical protein LBS40_00715 [Burkholderiales bacterium]|jgi:hypothetical protein|nr:hypothetical protein [Burkholderiales bacterium]
MKKFLPLLSAFLLTVFLVACGGDDNSGSSEGGSNPTPPPTDTQQSPGQISGLGEYPGELQGTSFTLPQGVRVDGMITGYRPATLSRSEKNTYAKDLPQKSAFDLLPADATIGGGYDVLLKIALINSNSTPTEVVFPERLILKSKSSQYQHGLLLKKTSVTIPAGARYVISLVMYCGNMERGAPSSSEIYEFGVISNSPLLKDLTDRLVNKKINVEEFNSDPSDYQIYIDQYLRLASIVWNLTDRGIALSDDDKNWIARLPASR